MAISNKEKWLASSDQTGNIFLWNLENGRLTAVLQSKVIKVIDASIGKDQKTLSLLYSSGELKIWNLENNNIYSEKFDSKKFLKGESENYFPTRIINETDSTLVFNVFKTKVNLTEAVIKAEAFAVTYNKRTNGYNFAITKSENYRSLLKRRNGRKTILETIEKFPEVNDERYLTDFESNLLKNKLVNGIVNNFHSDALFLDIVIKSNGELELISNKTKKKIKSIIVGDRDFIYINDSSYYYASKGALPFLAFRNGENIYDFDQFDVKYNRPDVIFSDLGFINQNQIEASKVLTKRE
ncbi:MAG: hypothetical protein IPG89_09955 [Bacteroidetes bacterium]|nr:hypothetical protein [Bacteroidota bacterium]